MLDACLIIPAYQPNSALVDVIHETLVLAEASPALSLSVLVVNDGSTSAEAQTIFETLKRQFPSLHILTLAQNQGKGGALKVGFGYIQERLADTEWIVTADADGQHLPKDILRIVVAGSKDSSSALGVRAFDPDMPLRSFIGNTLTRRLFRLINGIDVADTQTGLRGFSRDWLPRLQAIPYNG